MPFLHELVTTETLKGIEPTTLAAAISDALSKVNKAYKNPGDPYPNKINHLNQHALLKLLNSVLSTYILHIPFFYSFSFLSHF